MLEGLAWKMLFWTSNGLLVPIHVPTRNLLRHGNFNDFHLNHTCCIGVIGLDDITSTKLQVT
jgi:hypothetical protein